MYFFSAIGKHFQNALPFSPTESRLGKNDHFSAFDSFFTQKFIPTIDMYKNTVTLIRFLLSSYWHIVLGRCTEQTSFVFVCMCVRILVIIWILLL